MTKTKKQLLQDFNKEFKVTRRGIIEVIEIGELTDYISVDKLKQFLAQAITQTEERVRGEILEEIDKLYVFSDLDGNWRGDPQGNHLLDILSRAVDNLNKKRGKV